MPSHANLVRFLLDAELTSYNIESLFTAAGVPDAVHEVAGESQKDRVHSAVDRLAAHGVFLQPDASKGFFDRLRALRSLRSAEVDALEREMPSASRPSSPEPPSYRETLLSISLFGLTVRIYRTSDVLRVEAAGVSSTRLSLWLSMLALLVACAGVWMSPRTASSHRDEPACPHVSPLVSTCDF